MTRSPRSLLFVLGLVVALGLEAPRTLASVLRVPEQYESIQQAIVFAANRDIVRVSAGTYLERINFMGKSIAVIAVDGPEATILDGEVQGTVVTFASGEGSGSILTGFTIRNGYAFTANAAGGITCNGSSPTIQGNWIEGNAVNASGGGIACTFGASPRIEENVFVGNSCGNGRGRGFGSAIYCSGAGADPVIEGNDFRGNWADAFGTVAMVTGACPAILDNVFVDNFSSLYGNEGVFADRPLGDLLVRGNRVLDQRGAVRLYGCPNLRLEDNDFPVDYSLVSASPNALLVSNRCSGTLHITSSPGSMLIQNSFVDARVEISLSPATAVNSIFWHDSLSPIRLTSGGTLAATYCVIRGGWPGTGNLDADPLCVGGAVGDDVRLRVDSPCVDAGAPSVPIGVGETDLDGQPRVLAGVPGATPRIDIGADEMAIEHASRFGQIGAADPAQPPGEVVLVNGSAGDTLREVRVGPGDDFELRLEPPAMGPAEASFALYAYSGEPTMDTVSQQPGGLGWMTFGTPLSGDAPASLDCIWNNIGFPDRLGRHHRPSDSAPHLLFRLRHETLPPGLVVTLQGFMFDDRSTATVPVSVTNAVVVRVE